MGIRGIRVKWSALLLMLGGWGCAHGLRAQVPRTGVRTRHPAPPLARAAAVRVTTAAVTSAFASYVLAAPGSARALELPQFVKEQMGAGAERPFDVGGGGRRDGKSGYLNQCPSRRAGRTCICTFEDPYNSAYVPPWSYLPAEDSREYQRLVAAGGQGGKSADAAFAELVDVLRAAPHATVVEAKDRYILAEYRDPTFGTVDDVEFLFSTATPGIVNYRSAARTAGGDDKRHRERVKALRRELQPKGWRSVGRLNL